MDLQIRERGRPLVLLPSCTREWGAHSYQVVREPYLDALRQAGCTPLVVPAGSPKEWLALLDIAAGVLLTGSPSNVHPEYFGQRVRDTSLPLDARRDAAILPLIPALLARGIPMLAICRGLQEVNVALGGTLHQAVHEQDGLSDHRGSDVEGAAAMFAPAHAVSLVKGGLLQTLLGREELRVNSVHGQGVKTLAPGLRAEALAPDGLIEAFRKPDAPGFNLCVQWHPEWQADREPASRAVFKAFAHACEEYQSQVQEAWY